MVDIYNAQTRKSIGKRETTVEASRLFLLFYDKG